MPREFTTIPISALRTVPSRNSSSSTSTETDPAPVFPSESVAVSVMVWTPTDGDATSSGDPVPSAPSIELDQASAASPSVPSCGSVALPTKRTGVPSLTVNPEAGEVMTAVGAAGSDGLHGRVVAARGERKQGEEGGGAEGGVAHEKSSNSL